MAELDRAQIIRGKYDLDVVGHYARPDIFELHVDERPRQPVTIASGTAPVAEEAFILSDRAASHARP